MSLFLQITNVLSIKVSKIVYANWRLSKLCIRSYGVVFCFYFVLVCCDWLGFSGSLEGQHSLATIYLLFNLQTFHLIHEERREFVQNLYIHIYMYMIYLAKISQLISSVDFFALFSLLSYFVKKKCFSDY